MTEKPKALEQQAYASQYADQIASGIDKVTNRQEFKYDPMADANYQALAKLYNKQGEQAAKNTMGDAAILNGGYGSSFAVTASQQARNDYNQQLASQIPALQEAAYNRYVDNYNMDLSALQTLQSADDAEYGRHRDNVADQQWQYGQDYQAYRDTVGDEQWKTSFDYQKQRDKVADSQWQKEYNLAKKNKASSSRSSGSSGPTYVAAGGGGGGDNYAKVYADSKAKVSPLIKAAEIVKSVGNSLKKNKK